MSLFEERDGWRYTAFVTNTAVGALQWLEARHRAHAGVEDRIRCAKDTGLGRLPSREFAINAAWCQLTAMACDLIAWLQTLALDGELAKAEPKRLRYRLLHTAARLVHGQRRRRLRIPSTWPWAEQITAAFTRIAAIPAPADQHSNVPTTGGPKETTPTAATDVLTPCPRPNRIEHQRSGSRGRSGRHQP